ncbi:plasma membrane proteolipid Pmp3 [Saitozyma podzolica]|uniref:Plasma membrane proteolipid Pmp3 n=1 Tax=Saitozyma podzolica TaxID=1890683 RepID=A0A427YSW3_9TREE|nr:plasma membrane proteolipid Pmp3 [Saitozyma podzolica]
MAFTCSDIIKIVFAVILPPLGVFLERGCNADFFINILLTSASLPPLPTHSRICQPPKSAPTRAIRLSCASCSMRDAYIPGIIHALYIILKH